MNFYELLIRRSRPSHPSGGIPTDYVFYAPFKADDGDHSTDARTAGAFGSAPTYSTVDGVPCATFPASSGVDYAMGSMATGVHSRTLSMWIKASNIGESNCVYYYAGYSSARQTMHLGQQSGKMQGNTWTIAYSPSYTMDTNWHHYVMRYNATNLRLDFFVDGVSIASNSSTITFPDTSHISIGGSYQASYKPTGQTSYAAARIYDRALTTNEITALYNEDFTDASDSSSSGGVTPVLPTDYSRRYELTANLKDTKHPSDSTYDLTKPPYASTSYGTEDGIAGCKVTGTCLYSLTSTGLSTTNGFAVSFWAKCASTPASSANSKCMVNLSQYWSSSNIYWIGYVNGKWAGGVSSSSSLSQIRSDVAVDASWHCLTLNFDKTGQTISLWVDGVKAGELTGVSSLTVNNRGVVVNAGAATKGETTEAQPDVNVRYRDVTVFAKTLTEAEILGLAQEHRL